MGSTSTYYVRYAEHVEKLLLWSSASKLSLVLLSLAAEKGWLTMPLRFAHQTTVGESGGQCNMPPQTPDIPFSSRAHLSASHQTPAKRLRQSFTRSMTVGAVSSSHPGHHPTALPPEPSIFPAPQNPPSSLEAFHDRFSLKPSHSLHTLPTAFRLPLRG